MAPPGAQYAGPQTPEAGLQLQANDRLPPEALKDPEAQQGMGSAYATNQPHLAARYGVIRDGVHIAPQALRTKAPGKLSPATLRDLQTLQSLQQAQQSPETPAPAPVAMPKPEVELVEASSPRKEEPDQDENVISRLREMDDFDFGRLLEMVRKDNINNADQRAIIEKRLKPMGNKELTDMIITGYVRQSVPIIPDVFWVTFESMAGDTDLAIKRMIILEAGSDLGVQEHTNRYIQDKMAVYTVTAGLYALNNNVLPSHMKNNEFDEESFRKKFNYLKKYPIHMLSSLVANYAWFDTRVRALFVTESVKNG
jgi:hypothetical protein